MSSQNSGQKHVGPTQLLSQIGARIGHALLPTLLVGVIGLLFASSLAFAEPAPTEAPLAARWTGKDDANGEFVHVINTLNSRTGTQVDPSDFILYEDTKLATSRFRTYLQTAAQLPIKGRSVRIWTDLKTGSAIQVEALIESKAAALQLAKKAARFVDQDPDFVRSRTLELARKIVRAHRDDPNVRSITQADEWYKGEVVRYFLIKGKHGLHEIRIQTSTLKVVQKSYTEFPQAERVSRLSGSAALTASSSDEVSVPARVYPIYEETAGVRQERIITQLRHLKRMVPRVTADPYSSLKIKRYFEEDQDPVLGATSEGQAQGKWSMVSIKNQASLIRSTLPLSENSFANGLILEGRYATVNLHPDAAKISGLNFTPTISAQFKPVWKELSDGTNVRNEMVPSASYLGRPLMSFDDAFSRPARRLPNHDPASYLNDGFDEVQMYYAIDTLMDSLQGMGFTDPEISTRPFHAFLYDPDVSMRDNAFYTDDTINFTTYSPKALNFARDNSTIWHELGHGIMDRLMGDLLSLNDSGGLSEGMADFVASLVIARVTNGQRFPGQEGFRIVNNTAFFLTNESHDDGEAYGGAMYDLLNAARAKFGEAGTVKVADLTMEAMRLSRNHPALTAPDWFNHLLFADERGNAPLRAPGELSQLIVKALAGRNFAYDPLKAASFALTYDSKPVNAGDVGSRAKPIRVSLRGNETAKYSIQVSAKESADYSLHFPITVKVSFEGAPIQGAIHWIGKEKGAKTYTLKTADDIANIDLEVSGTCDAVNRPDGSCVDYAYVQLIPSGMSRPIGKKRFYLRVYKQN
jgi:hypothetical protein